MAQLREGGRKKCIIKRKSSKNTRDEKAKVQIWLSILLLLSVEVYLEKIRMIYL